MQQQPKRNREKYANVTYLSQIGKSHCSNTLTSVGKGEPLREIQGEWQTIAAPLEVSEGTTKSQTSGRMGVEIGGGRFT